MTVVVADLAEIEATLARLLDERTDRLLVPRKEACQMLALSDSTFGRLLREGVIAPVPHARPPRYSVELLRRFAAGDGDAFSALSGADGSPGSIDADADAPAPVSPLVRPRQGTGGPRSTARGGPTTPAA